MPHKDPKIRKAYNHQYGISHRKECRIYELRYRLKYDGLTKEDIRRAVRALFRRKKCQICKKKQSYTALHVDHDHKTRKFRGILCRKCNLILGHADDSIRILKKSIEYLERTKQ